MNEQIIIKSDGTQGTVTNIEFSRKHRKLKKVVLIILATFLVVFIATLSAFPPIMLNDMLNSHISFDKIYSAEQFGITSKDQILTTSDNLKIATYEVFTPTPKAVVIIVSGIQGPSVTTFFGHSVMLQKNGYASILCEMRAHGNSEGEVISVGYKEYLDVKAVVDYIKSNDNYLNVPIVVYGLSMGAAVAINSIGEIPEIDGLMSMSAYSSWEDVFCDNMENIGIPKFICDMEKPFVKVYTTLKFGFDTMNISPVNEIKKLGERPALLYHSRGDTQVPFSSFERIIGNAPNNVERLIRDGDHHFPTENLDKPEEDEEYSNRIIGFLDSHFAK